MDITGIRAVLTTAFFAVVRYVMRFFRPCVEDILADIQRKVDKLDRVIDEANDKALRQIDYRRGLRAQIEQSNDEEDAQWSIASQASRLRDDLRKIIL